MATENTEKQPNPITAKNVEAIGQLEKQAMQRRTASERFAELITRYAGGIGFILLHIIWFTGWILFNLGMVSGITPWDPFSIQLSDFGGVAGSDFSFTPGVDDAEPAHPGR